MKKVLVTGATGFLGKYIIDELVSHNYQVIYQLAKFQLCLRNLIRRLI